MNSFASLVFPAFIGLLAGIGHGWVSHEAGLPVSLGEQLVQPFVID